MIEKFNFKGAKNLTLLPLYDFNMAKMQKVSYILCDSH